MINIFSAVMPAQAGIQRKRHWIHAFAGITRCGVLIFALQLAGCTEIPMPKLFGSSGPENATPVMAEGAPVPAMPTPEQRISALEASVAGMQKDIAGFMPYLKKIDGIEVDLRALVKQLQSGIEATPLVAPQADDAPAAAGKLAVRNPAPPEVFDPNGPPMVRRVRIGNNGATTRIVLDVTKKAPYRYDLDNAEKILVIELPDAGWASDRRKWDSAKKSKLIASYSVQEGAGGKSNMLVVQLRKETSIVKEGKIDPVPGKDYRIYLDLKS